MTKAREIAELGQTITVDASGNIDVSGTGTFDGLTVDGAVEVDTARPQIFLHENDRTGNNTRLESSFDNFNIAQVDDTNNSPVNRLSVEMDTGDINFYEDTGTTAKFVWDASAEKLEIGSIEGGADGLLAVKTNADNHAIAIEEASGSEAYAIGVESDGSLGFYNSGSTTASVLFDDSGRVGIGTTSPAHKLHVADATTPEIIVEDTTNNVKAVLGADNSVGRIGTDTNHPVTFRTNDTERMRIDSSGNLLVGKTSQDDADTAGITLAANNTIYAARSGAAPLLLNRLSSDGGIVSFRKDGTTVGSIGASTKSTVSRLMIGTGDTGLYFFDTIDAIYPVTMATGADRDNAVSLGDSTSRFKDLYLSGGAYLGGTTSANKLDDYETGTFTMGVTFAGGDPTAGPSQASGYYVKTGNSCTIWVRVTDINVTGGSGDLRLDASGGNDGLPFVSLAAGTTGIGVYVGSATLSNCDVGTSCVQVNAQQIDGVAYIRFTEQIDNGATDIINVGNCTHGSTNIDLCMTYPVA